MHGSNIGIDRVSILDAAEAGRVRVCSPWKDELSEAIGMRREQDFGVAKRFRNQAGNYQH